MKARLPNLLFRLIGYIKTVRTSAAHTHGRYQEMSNQDDTSSHTHAHTHTHHAPHHTHLHTTHTATTHTPTHTQIPHTHTHTHTLNNISDPGHQDHFHIFIVGDCQ